MLENHPDGNEHAHHPHHHACANLFGCGDEKGTGVVRDDIKDAHGKAFGPGPIEKK